MTRDVAAAVLLRLLSRAKAQGAECERLLVRYTAERFLHRPAAWPVRDRCVPEGAGLLTLWLRDPSRATRDIDLPAFGPSGEAAIRSRVAESCSMPCRGDGMRFDLRTLAVTPIRADEEYDGLRAELRAFLGTAGIRVQIDFGFGDAVPPAPELAV